MTTTTALARNLKGSHKKLHIAAQYFQGKKVDDAMEQLEALVFYGGDKNVSKKSASLIKSVLMNAVESSGADPEDLIISQSVSEQGVKYKRMRPRARGRSARYVKHNCHLRISVKINKEA